MVITGLERLAKETALQNNFKGKVALLCHQASVDSNFHHAMDIFASVFKERFIKIFGPQHGIVTDVQDNMIETDHSIHPHYKLPVYSLYSETRIPTERMLEDIDHLFIDLQDVGTRIYTYIYTMTYVLEACADKDIEVIILDRPNPINAKTIEGNILEEQFASFVGRHPIAVRHALTMAEVALMHQKFWTPKTCKLTVIEMQNYKREMDFEATGLPWVMPSPNLPTVEGCFTFVGTVLFEGTNISEGRGTTRSLEIIGHPSIKNPWQYKKDLDALLKKNQCKGYFLRPIMFQPTFQKHAGNSCGGFQIHVTSREEFRPWKLCQLLCKYLIHTLGDDFNYKQDPYEYESEMNPVDMINGTDKLRHWYHKEFKNDSFLLEIENQRMQMFLAQRSEVKIY